MADATLVRAEGLARRYTLGTNAVNALDGVDLLVERGEFVALVGPSGSGKSTLLNLVGGLVRPTGGTITVNGLELGASSDARLVGYRRDTLGFIFQGFNLLPVRSAAENVELPLMLAGTPPRLRRERALELLALVGLAERARHKPAELSGGEQQRVAIARALANRPALLLADEPTGNLDSTTGREILALLQQRIRDDGLTLMLVTHDMSVAAYADRVVHMRDGKVVRIEQPQSLPQSLEVEPR